MEYNCNSLLAVYYYVEIRLFIVAYILIYMIMEL